MENSVTKEERWLLSFEPITKLSFYKEFDCDGEICFNDLENFSKINQLKLSDIKIKMGCEYDSSCLVMEAVREATEEEIEKQKKDFLLRKKMQEDESKKRNKEYQKSERAEYLRLKKKFEKKE